MGTLGLDRTIAPSHYDPSSHAAPLWTLLTALPMSQVKHSSPRVMKERKEQAKQQAELALVRSTDLAARLVPHCSICSPVLASLCTRDCPDREFVEATLKRWRSA